MRVVAGSAKGRQLKSPKSAGTRPIIDRVKTALFDILGDRVVDAEVLDLFGGVGSVGIEALSRGAKHATFIELDGGVAAILRENVRSTGFSDQAGVVRGDAFRFLQSASGRQFDLIYVAPPQYKGLAARAFQEIDARAITSPSGAVIVQIHPKERIDLISLTPQHLRLADERRYGSTLLMFFEARPNEEA